MKKFILALITLTIFSLCPLSGLALIEELEQLQGLICGCPEEPQLTDENVEFVYLSNNCEINENGECDGTCLWELRLINPNGPSPFMIAPRGSSPCTNRKPENKLEACKAECLKSDAIEEEIKLGPCTQLGHREIEVIFNGEAITCCCGEDT